MDGRLAIDTTVLLAYFVIIISIGLYMGRKEENLADFVLGRRQIAWWAILASLIAAETSAGTFFGTPGEGFTFRNSLIFNSPSARSSHASWSATSSSSRTTITKSIRSTN